MFQEAFNGGATLCFSHWNVGEVLGTLQRRARLSGRVQAYAGAKARLHGELNALRRLGFLETVGVTTVLLRDAWRLLEKHAIYVADALQLATASARACGMFLSADRQLLRAAVAEGLSAFDVLGEGPRIRRVLQGRGP